MYKCLVYGLLLALRNEEHIYLISKIESSTSPMVFVNIVVGLASVRKLLQVPPGFCLLQNATPFGALIVVYKRLHNRYKQAIHLIPCCDGRESCLGCSLP